MKSASEMTATVDVVVNGHIHKSRVADSIGGTRYFNPGALSRVSRDDQRSRTHLVLVDSEDPEVVSGRYFTFPCSPEDAFTMQVELPGPAGSKRVDVDRIVTILTKTEGQVSLDEARVPLRIRELAKSYFEKAKEESLVRAQTFAE
jgi:hypothetical protein